MRSSVDSKSICSQTNRSIRLSHRLGNSHLDSFDQVLYKFKIILLGSSSVGKTSIMSAFIGQWPDQSICSIGVAAEMITMHVEEGIAADLHIWDTCGEEKFKTVTRQYYRNCNGIVLVFDITCRSSFADLKGWIQEVSSYAPRRVDVLIVGNKADLAEFREVSFSEASAFAEELSCDYIEVSAVERLNIDLCFNMLSKSMMISAEEKRKSSQKCSLVSKSKSTSKAEHGYSEGITLENCQNIRLDGSRSALGKKGCC